MKNVFIYFTISIIGICFTQCSDSKPIIPVSKISVTDPFSSTIAKSQLFTINALQDTVLEGINGTILVLPKGCFIDENNDVIDSKITIELSEVLSLTDMLLSNLMTATPNKLLETDGMIYINAISNGKQLKVNPSQPIYIEIPTRQRKPNMMIYKGIRDEKGNMSWSNPKNLETYLTTVDLKSLDFLPEGFRLEVEKNLPFKNHTIANQEFIDSLFYSFSVRDTLYPRYRRIHQSNLLATHSDVNDTSKLDCGIDPAIIKLIKTDKYQNTFIATREFETRLQYIFKTCRNNVIEAYIKNLDKNLYEADELAIQELTRENEYLKADFERFAQQRLTKVKDADKYASLLKGYYENQIHKVKSELEQNLDTYRKRLGLDSSIYQDYKRLVLQRERYRMESYGFLWTDLGWLNVDKDILTEPNIEQPLEVKVSNNKDFDKIFVYLISTEIKSLYQLKIKDKSLFYKESSVNFPKNKKMVLFAIGYKGEKIMWNHKEFILDAQSQQELRLNYDSKEKLDAILSQYDNFSIENKIKEEIKYLTSIYKIEQKRDFQFTVWYNLRDIVEPCCNINSQ